MVNAALALWYQGKQRRRRDNPPAIPDTITDLVATAQSDTEIQLDFTPDGDADYHQCRYRPAIGGDWSALVVVEPLDAIDGLDPETAYEFQVSGYSERWGRGGWSAGAVETTDEP